MHLSLAIKYLFSFLGVFGTTRRGAKS